MHAVDLDVERAALDDIRAAAEEKLERFTNLKAIGADAVTVEFVDSVRAGAIEQLQQELVVFGRIDDDEIWRVGLYGVDRNGAQVVIDWRARFSAAFYQAKLDEPMGLDRRVSYVGAIDELFIEEFATGEISGSSPLMNELSRSRGETMKAAVATLQSEQDELVRLDPDERLVLIGGPGTGKTVVGLHRAAWLVYNDRRVHAADRLLVVGPTEKYLDYVASVLPTLGEAKIRQTTFARLLGPSSRVGATADWPTLLDNYEASLYSPKEVMVGRRKIGADTVGSIIERIAATKVPWREKRKALVYAFGREVEGTPAQIRDAASTVMPAVSAAAAWKQLKRPAVLRTIGLDASLIDEWVATPEDGPILDELKARFEEKSAQYSHAIVDEAQDISVMQLRAVHRRSKGLTFVGDDAQISEPGALGLRSIAGELGITPAELTTAYRMSSEIADWLNRWATSHGLPAVELVGIRPNGVAVRTAEDLAAEAAALAARDAGWALIDHESVWTHKGIEYDTVLVDGRDMDPAEVYLAASRAAHELIIHGI